ncbi:conserved domain protein [delta proteobacterium NaphS2]|nr:conserved domain protein [delta proteobacterium NaphS2]
METQQKEALINQVKQRFQLMVAHLSEKDKRIWAASEANTIGRGGDTIVCQATGISRVTIGRGKKELTGKADGVKRRIRKPGGGRKRLSDKNPALIKDLVGRSRYAADNSSDFFLPD